MKNFIHNVLDSRRFWVNLIYVSFPHKAIQAKKQYLFHPNDKVISHLKRTSENVPTQWEGFLADGRLLYIRFRNNTLTVHVLEDNVITLEDIRNPIHKFSVASAGVSNSLDSKEMLKILATLGYKCASLEDDVRFHVPFIVEMPV